MTSEPVGGTRSGSPRRAVILGPIPPMRGGIAQHTARVAEAAAAAGNRVIVESWSSQYPRLLYRRAQNDPEATPFPGARRRLRWFDPLSWVGAARRARGCDLLVIVWVTPFHALPTRVIALLAGARRTVAIIHNVHPHEKMPFVRTLTRLGLGRRPSIVCHARSLVDDLHRMGIRPVRAEVLPMPSLVPVESSPLPPRPPLRLLFLGFQRHYKGPDIAVDALRRLVDQGVDATLTVAGERWGSSEDLRPLIAERRLGERVELIERYLSDDELATILARHHLLLAPYRSATQSGVVSSALASGRPAVVTPVGGLPDAVADGVTGIVAESSDPDAVAEGVIRAIDDLDGLAASLSRHRVDWSDVATRLLDEAAA